MNILHKLRRKRLSPEPEEFRRSRENSDEEFRQFVNARALRLIGEVEREFEALGFQIHSPSGYMREARIEMGRIVGITTNDEEAKKRIRPIVKRWLRP